MKLFLSLSLLGLLLVSVECLQKLSILSEKGVPEKRENLRVFESKTGKGMAQKREEVEQKRDEADRMKLPEQAEGGRDSIPRAEETAESRLRELLQRFLSTKRRVETKKKREQTAGFSQACYDYFGEAYSHRCADQSYCIPSSSICDGSTLCPDGSDEVGCSSGDSGNTVTESNSGGDEGCLAGSTDLYSSGCSSYFADYPCGCSSGGLCLSHDQVCSGLIQCSDGSDEAGCDYGYGTQCGSVDQTSNSGIFASGGSSGELSQELKDQLLEAHNFFRCLHDVGSLTWDDTLATSATEVAQDNANKGYLEHSDGTLSNGEDYGENLASAGISSSTTITGFGFTKMWYDEIEYYNYNNPGFSSVTGHFTQVVWESSTKLGCGLAISGTNYFLACQYQTPGNSIGQFEQKVSPPIY